MSGYDNAFFDRVDAGAFRSAEAVVELLMGELRVCSVLDVGCGRGVWTSCFKRAGCSVVLGLDGDYVNRSGLYINAAEFEVVDLNHPFNLERRFDLVVTLEVAEHLSPEASEYFVSSLVRHGNVVLFGAAIPGQGGIGHINERPLEFWRRLFEQHGYWSYDFLRPLIRLDSRVEPFYRYNTILYASKAGRDRLSTAIQRSEVPNEHSLAVVAPFSWRLRCIALRHVPVRIVNFLASVRPRLEREKTSRWSSPRP